MPHKRLTPAGIEALKAPRAGQVDYFDQATPAFGLRVSAKGTKSFFVMTRVGGKLARVTLGRFPDPSRRLTNGGMEFLTLKRAREKAEEVVKIAAEGKDPRKLAEEKKAKDAADAGNTFHAVAESFMADYAPENLKPRTQDEYRRALFGKDTEHLHKRAIASITEDDVAGILHVMRARGANGSADRTLAYLRSFMNWAAKPRRNADGTKYRLIPASPISDLESEYEANPRERVLTAHEVKLIWQAFDMEEYPRPKERSLFAPMLKLLMLTGQRRNEVAGMAWDELRDLEGAAPLWEIPGSRTKNSLPHLVPLSPMAMAVLATVPRTGPLVFSTTGATHMSGFSRLKARIDGYLGGLAKGQGIKPVAPWRLHDMRRTMVTGMNEMGVEPHIVEAVVNHISGRAKAGVAGVYNRAQYLDGRRKALNAWADHLAGLVRHD